MKKIHVSYMLMCYISHSLLRFSRSISFPTHFIDNRAKQKFGAILFLKNIYSNVESEKHVSKENCKMVTIFANKNVYLMARNMFPFCICGQETYSWLHVKQFICYLDWLLDG